MIRAADRDEDALAWDHLVLARLHMAQPDAGHPLRRVIAQHLVEGVAHQLLEALPAHLDHVPIVAVHHGHR